MPYHYDLSIKTQGRGTYDISASVNAFVTEAGIEDGLCHVFVQHTSASLILCENADPDVRRDLEMLFARLAPDGDPEYLHTAEGSDDMAAHARSVLSTNSLTIPIRQGQLALGTWQGVYLWEHRAQAHHRRLIISLSTL